MLCAAGGGGQEKDHVLDHAGLGIVGNHLAEGGVHPGGEPCLLPDLPGGGIRLALAALHVALGEAPVTAVVPGEQVFPPPLRHPPDHRAAGFFLRRFVKYAAVPPGPGAAVGPQLKVELGDAQVHQAEGRLLRQMGHHGVVPFLHKAVGLAIPGGGGPLYGGYAGHEPGGSVAEAGGQLRRSLDGPVGHVVDQVFPAAALRRYVADGGHADQPLSGLQVPQTEVPVIGAAHPAGAQAHGGGGEDDPLAIVAALLVQVGIGLRSCKDQVVGHAGEHSVAFRQGGKGLRLIADELDVKPGPLVGLINGFAQLQALLCGNRNP